MLSDTVKVSSAQVAPALDLVEKTAAYIGYPADYCQKARLLGEELIASIQFMLDDVDASLWVETDKDDMRIHLKLEGTLSDATRDKLVQVSKERRNEKPKGFLKRVGAFFSDAFMADSADYVPLYIEGGAVAGSYYLPLSLLDRTAWKENAPADELDGMEAALLQKLADDVTVCARPSYAELTVIKKLPAKA